MKVAEELIDLLEGGKKLAVVTVTFETGDTYSAGGIPITVNGTPIKVIGAFGSIYFPEAYPDIANYRIMLKLYSIDTTATPPAKSELADGTDISAAGQVQIILIEG